MNLNIKHKLVKSGLTIILVICSTVLFTTFQGCEKNEELDIENLDVKSNEELLQILRDQINISLNNSTKSASISEYKLFKEENIYTHYPKSLFKIAKKMKKVRNNESLEDVQIRFEKEASKLKTPQCFNGKASEIESEIYQEIMIHLKDKNESESVEIFNTIFRFANDYICNENQRKRILYTIETLKFLYKKDGTDFSKPRLKSLTENSYGGYLLTDCQHRCMNNRLESMDGWDWLEAAMAPPLYTAGMYLTCLSVCG